MLISLNDVYKIQEPRKDIVRVLAIQETVIIVISLLKQDTLPYELALVDLEDAIYNGVAEVSDEYPEAFFPKPTETQERVAEENWKIIGDFVRDIPDCFDSKVRSRFIAAKSRETKKQRKQIQRLLYRYWAGGSTKHALYPSYNNCGAPGKPRSSVNRLGRKPVYETNVGSVSVGDKEKKYIEEAITKYYTKHTKYSYRYAYRKMLEERYTDSSGTLANAYPTENQFRYHGAKFVDIKKRVGGVKYNKDYRGITGSSRQEANGPGDVYQIDATVADIYLVSHENRKAVVGRPELYFVTDVFSRMIVGFYACLESASWDNAREALLNAFTDKVEFCRSYDVAIQPSTWPCVGLPRALVVDNGELVSKASNTIIEGLGIEVKNAPAWRPDLKGIVESRFRLLNISTKAAVPGAVLPNFKERGAEDYRLDAKLTLSEFTQMLIHFILNHNRRALERHPQPLPDILADHVPAIPLELWNWGIRNRSGSLRKTEKETLRVALAQRAQARVTQQGIRFHNLYYECATAQEDNWFSKARMKGTWLIDIAYHPGNMEEIYWLKNARDYEVCARTEDNGALYGKGSLEEILWIQQQKKARAASYADVSLQADVDSIRAIDEIVQRANQEAKVISLENARMKSKPGEIRKNRKEEAEKLRRKKMEAPLEQTNVEKAPQKKPGLRSTSAYDAKFARFSEEEEDE